MPAPDTVTAQFEQAVQRAPEATALVGSDRRVTYAALDDRRRRAAAWIVGLGIRPGDRVVLVAESSIDYVIAFLGALTAGAAVAPLPPDTSPASVAGAAARLGSRLILSSATSHASVSDVIDGIAVAQIPADFETVEPATLSPPAARDVALILQTSGTTSAPKAVLLTHGNLAANTSAIIESLGLGPADSVLTVLPFFYSYGNSVLLTHLAAGAKVVIETRFAFPEVVVQALDEHRPTGFYGVPTTFYVLLSRTTFPQRPRPFLRYVAQAGGAMRPAAIAQLRACVPDGRVYVMYGQTEAAARLTVLPPEALDAKLGSIGWPIPGVEMKVLADAGGEAPRGAVGELAARGPSIMLGYDADPEATARALDGGWLHTGDAGYQDVDGCFWVVGRRADFIKSAGIRVAPAEIEAVVAEIDGIQDVAAFAVDDDLLGEAIAVSVVTGASTPSSDAILTHCRSRLPSVKWPRRVFFESALPRTASGKTQYFALRDRHRRD